MILGWLFIRPIPPPTSDSVNTPEGAIQAPRPTSSRVYFERSDDSATRLLPENELEYDETYVQSPRRHTRTMSVASCGEVGTGDFSENEQPNVSGKELFMSPRFWLLFSITSLRESPNIRCIEWVLTRPSEWCGSDV